MCPVLRIRWMRVTETFHRINQKSFSTTLLWACPRVIKTKTFCERIIRSLITPVYFHIISTSARTKSRVCLMITTPWSSQSAHVFITLEIVHSLGISGSMIILPTWPSGHSKQEPDEGQENATIFTSGFSFDRKSLGKKPRIGVDLRGHSNSIFYKTRAATH